MSHRTSATIILDSITPYGPQTRLTSMYVVFPKMILGERNRHRGFSLSDRSSRAVPTEKLVAEVMEDPAMPAKFRRRAKGIGGGEELTGEELNKVLDRWMGQAWIAANTASAASEEEAKETANRHLDAYIRMHSLMTATRDVWFNFFGLRLDAGADPTIQVLAQRCFEAYKSSSPTILVPGQWHLPFISLDEIEAWWNWEVNVEDARKISAARCAHLSYNDLETGQRMTPQRAFAIYDKLVTSKPIHASPCEHQACVDENLYRPEVVSGHLLRNVHERGNFAAGWRQFRKMLPGEAVADLPEGYNLNA